MITEAGLVLTGIAVGFLADSIIKSAKIELAYDTGVEDGFNRHKAMIKAERKETINSDALDDLVEAFSFSQVCGDCPFKSRCVFINRPPEGLNNEDGILMCQRTVYRELNIEV